MNRRKFFNFSPIALGLTLPMLKSEIYATEKTQFKARRQNSIALATYSFWRFKKGLKFPIEKCIDLAAEMGFDGWGTGPLSGEVGSMYGVHIYLGADFTKMVGGSYKTNKLYLQVKDE